jgi:hypothetical protein
MNPRGVLPNQPDSTLITCQASLQELFQLLDASDLFELLPDYDFSLVGDMVVNDEWL